MTTNNTLCGEFWLANGLLIPAGDSGDDNHASQAWNYLLEEFLTDLQTARWREPEVNCEWLKAIAREVATWLVADTGDPVALRGVIYDTSPASLVDCYATLRNIIAWPEKQFSMLIDNDADGAADDIRDWIIREKHWIRVANNNIQLAVPVGVSQLREIARGLQDAFGKDALDTTFNVEIKGHRGKLPRYFEQVPFAIFSHGSVGELRRYRVYS